MIQIVSLVGAVSACVGASAIVSTPVPGLHDEDEMRVTLDCQASPIRSNARGWVWGLLCSDLVVFLIFNTLAGRITRKARAYEILYRFTQSSPASYNPSPTVRAGLTEMPSRFY